MSDEPEQDEQPQQDEQHEAPPAQPSARWHVLQQQAQHIGQELARLQVSANWGHVINAGALRPYAGYRGLTLALVAKGLLTQDEAECWVMEAVVQDMEALLHYAEEQALKAKGPQLALPGAPQVPPGILDMQALRNGHRH